MISSAGNQVVCSSLLPIAISNQTCLEFPRLSRNERYALSQHKLMPDIPALHQVECHAGKHTQLWDTQTLRVAAWNLEQGRHWQKAIALIQSHPILSQVDIWLLTEVDHHLKRSGYVHVAQQIAQALGYHCLFGVEFLESTWLMEQRFGAIDYSQSVGYHGNAILSRYPLESPFLIRYPLQQKWWSKQGRIGGRMGLGATIRHANMQPITLLTTHLESGVEPPDFMARRQEVGILMRYLTQYYSRQSLILGGDFNARPTWPEMRCLDQAGYNLATTNDLLTPTMQRIQQGQLKQMPYHIDYILAARLSPSREVAPCVIPAIYPQGTGLEGYISDHHVMVAELKLLNQRVTEA